EVTVAVRVERVEAFTRHPRHLLTRELPIRVAVHGGEAIDLHRLAVRSRLLARHLPVAVGVDGVEAFERALGPLVLGELSVAVRVGALEEMVAGARLSTPTFAA